MYNEVGNIVHLDDGWGNCTIDSSTTNYDLAHANPIRYRGYYYDEDTKLYYLNARYYSPTFRRFISPDDTAYLNPKNVNGCNLYCYCGNDSINFVDPSGHDIIMIIGLIGCFGVVIAGAVVVVVGAVIETLVTVVEFVINALSWIFEGLASTEGVDAFTGASPIAAPNPGT